MSISNIALIILAVIALVGMGYVIATNTSPSTQSHRSYSISSNADKVEMITNSPTLYSFSIIDDQGNTTKEFNETHTKLMHVIVVRKDLAYFQHVHPEFDAATGMFTLSDLTLPADGEYRIFADFSPVGSPLTVTISEDVKVGSDYTPQPLGTDVTTKTFDGLQVALSTHSALESSAENMLMFSLADASGKPIADLQPYLGALGHSVILREGTLDFIHAHPMEEANAAQDGTVDFMVNFPKPGKYKVFTQFQRGGKVTLADFVVNVTQSSMPASMPGMDHSAH